METRPVFFSIQTLFASRHKDVTYSITDKEVFVDGWDVCVATRAPTRFGGTCSKFTRSVLRTLTQVRRGYLGMVRINIYFFSFSRKCICKYVYVLEWLTSILNYGAGRLKKTHTGFGSLEVDLYTKETLG